MEFELKPNTKYIRKCWKAMELQYGIYADGIIQLTIPWTIVMEYDTEGSMIIELDNEMKWNGHIITKDMLLGPYYPQGTEGYVWDSLGYSNKCFFDSYSSAWNSEYRVRCFLENGDNRLHKNFLPTAEFEALNKPKKVWTIESLSEYINGRPYIINESNEKFYNLTINLHMLFEGLKISFDHGKTWEEIKND